MRIAHVCPWFYPHLGGVESHVRSLSRELAARGHDVTVVTTRHDPALPTDEAFDGFHVVRVKPRAVLLRTPVVPRLKAVLRELPVDIIHAQSPPPLSAYYASGVAKARGIPFVVTYQCDLEIPAFGGALVESAFRRTLGAATLRRADRIVVTTRTYAATSRQVWRYNPAVIPAGVDPHRFHAGIDGSALREKLGIPPGRPMVLSVSRLVPHKGLEDFIEAARYVPYADFVIAGEGPSLPALQRLARRLGVQDRVRFAGRVSDEELPALHAAADAFVLPSISRLEAFGIAALEAMSTGTPVVLSDIPGVREVIEDGREGLLADPLNPGDLGAKIRVVLADPGRAEAMGRRGREKVLAAFSIERIAIQLEALYESLQSPIKR